MAALAISLAAYVLAVSAAAFSPGDLHDTAEARADEVVGLPGASFPMPSRQFSGYISDGRDGQLHYWLVESERDAATDPVALWLNGGPGSSSLMGYLTELGPYVIAADGNLSYNPYTWAKQASVLFLEAPAGVGFSYCNGSVSAVCTANDDSMAAGNLQALRRFFERFPRLQGNPLMLWGESYAGIYVPTLAKAILDAEPPLPAIFLGFSVGNACTADKYQLNSPLGMFMDGNPDYALSVGLIDVHLFKKLNSSACKDRLPNESDSCRAAWRRFNLASAGFLGRPSLTPGLGDGAGFLDGYDMGAYVGSIQPYWDAMEAYLKREDVRRALHVQHAPIWSQSSSHLVYHKQYLSCRDDSPGYDIGGAPQKGISMLPVYSELIKRGLSTLLYNGDADPNMQWRGSELSARGVGIPEVEGHGWRPWFYREAPAPLDLMLVKAPEWGPALSLTPGRIGHATLGGYVESFAEPSSGGTLTFVTVRDVGHMVPQFRPQAAQHLFARTMEAAIRSRGAGPELAPPLPADFDKASAAQFYGARGSPGLVGAWFEAAQRMAREVPLEADGANVFALATTLQAGGPQDKVFIAALALPLAMVAMAAVNFRRRGRCRSSLRSSS